MLGLLLAIFRKENIINKKNAGKSLCLAAVILLIEILLLSAPNLKWFSGLYWNWQGKLVSFIVILIFMALKSKISWKDIGMSEPHHVSWIRVFITIIAFASLIFFFSSSNQSIKIDFETILFQALMPSLEEEFIYRGILWNLAAGAFPGSKKLWKANAGWNLVIISVLFSLIHSVSFDSNLSIIFISDVMISTFVASFSLGWIRAYSGSLLPAVVLHSGINLSACIIPWLIS